MLAITEEQSRAFRTNRAAGHRHPGDRVSLQNKRVDGINRQFDEIVRRLERIEAKLDNHESRIAVLEERTSRLRIYPFLRKSSRL